jgi:FAD/FMN-containing dehydrogenase
VAHPGGRAKEVLQFFREQTKTAPDEVFMAAAMLTAPDGSGNKLIGIAMQHSGPLPAGEAFAKSIKAFGPPVMDVIGPMPYAASNMMLDDAFPAGARNYWKSHFLHELSDGAIDALVAQLDRLPTPMCQMLVENFHGAATRVPVDETAYALRHTGYNVLIMAEWQDAKDDQRCIAWAREAYASLKPFISERRYTNYVADDEMNDPANLVAAYGPNAPRLRQIKKRYDPENVFRLNLNIPPAE